MPEQSELPQQEGKRGKIIIKSRKEQTDMICKRLTPNERPAFPKRAIITAGMPYGNKNLHFGHVGGMFIHADIFARFLRDRIGKDNVIFLSGTDCYGSPIMESFRKLQEQGQEGSLEDYVYVNHEKQKKTLESYGISLDFFGASALGEAGRIHRQVSAEVFHTLYENGYITKLSMPQFYDEEKEMFLNGRQVIGKCPIPGCTSEKAYADECSLGHQFLPSELINPVSCLSNKKPVLKDVENWYFDLEHCIPMVKEYNDFLRKNTNTRKYQLETVEEFLKKPLLYAPRKYIDDLEKLIAKLPPHKLGNDEKKPSVVFEFANLDDRDKAKNILDAENIHYTSGKTLVPFRLSGNVEWGVPFPECENLKDLTFWVWPESLWAPISFTLAYLRAKETVTARSVSGEFPDAEQREVASAEMAPKWRLRNLKSEDELSKWWFDDESEVYQFIGEDNIYFYAIAQTGLFTGLQVPKGEAPDMEKVHLSHIIANRHLLYMDAKASSSSEVKPPAAEELLNFYTKDQLRMHFMSLGLSSKSVSFKPQAFMKEEDREGVDMVLKDGNLITNVFNRLIRTCFYAIQNNCGGRIPKGEACGEIRLMAEKAVLDYERHMYNHEFHRISYILDDFIRSINRHWVNNVKIADASGDMEFRKQLIVDCFYACKITAILVHPIAPEGCEMFREYLCLGEKLWDWNYILEPISAYVEDIDSHQLKFLEPRVDFFKKHDCQLKEALHQ